MKKVIIVNYVGRKGGGPLDAFEMAKALVNKGEAVIPIISSEIDNREMWNQVSFEKIIEVNTYKNKLEFIVKTLLFYLFVGKKIKKEIQGYTVMVSYSPMITFWTTRINHLLHPKKTITVCHDPVPHSGENALIKLFGEKQYVSDVVIVHSKKFIDIAEKRFGNVRYIALGPHNMYKQVANKQKCIEYSKNMLNFVFFGRIEDYKGVDILISAFSIVQKKYKDVTLSIIGNGDFTKYLQDFKELKNSTLINRFVKDEEVDSIFTGENLICVCPYKDATQSGAVLVAYDYGVPVIATDAGGLAEQVIDGKTGFLVQPNNIQSLASSMEKFYLDVNLVPKMKHEIDEYLKTISWNKSAEHLLEIIGEE